MMRGRWYSAAFVVGTQWRNLTFHFTENVQTKFAKKATQDIIIAGYIMSLVAVELMTY
jgi:hypothetical protein